jgi:hypothetical protein
VTRSSPRQGPAGAGSPKPRDPAVSLRRGLRRCNGPDVASRIPSARRLISAPIRWGMRTSSRIAAGRAALVVLVGQDDTGCAYCPFEGAVGLGRVEVCWMG